MSANEAGLTSAMAIRAERMMERHEADPVICRVVGSPSSLRLVSVLWEDNTYYIHDFLMS